MKRFSADAAISVLMVLCMMASAPGYAGASRAVETQTLVLFPIACGVEFDDSEYAQDLFVLIKEGLVESGRYSVIAYNPKITCVQRAVQERKIDEKAATGPFTTDSAGIDRVKKLCEAMGAQLGLIGSLDKCEFQDGRAEVTATLQILEASTGEVKKSATASGQASAHPEDSGQSQKGLTIAAVYDAAEKLLTEVAEVSSEQLTGTPDTSVSVPLVEESPAPKRNRLLPAMITALIVGLMFGGR